MRVLLIVYDNGSYIHLFPQGTAYLASVLRNENYEVEIYHQHVYHYPEQHLTDYLNKNKFDVVGLGVIGGYYQYRKLLKISRAINISKNRPEYFILGGHGPSPEPAYFMDKTEADIVVIGEGEETIIELLGAISNKKSFNGIKGTAFRKGNKVVINQRRPTIEDIDSIPWPAYDMFPIEYYRLARYPHCTNEDFVIQLLSGRGCIFKCNFCYRMDKGCRVRSPELLIGEIKYLQKQYRITYIDFSDELLMVSKERIIKLCQAFLKQKLKFKWFCNGRLNYAKPDILELMKESGCVFINYGIESVDDQILKNMNKALTTKQIIKGIEATLKVGISPGFNIIFGNIGETQETLQKGVNFLLKYDDGAQLRTIRPVTPYPGCPLYYYAIEKGLLKDVDDFYNNKHINSDLLSVNFTDLSDEKFHEILMEANLTLLKNYYRKKYSEMVDITKKLYLEKDATFRGYRQT